MLHSQCDPPPLFVGGGGGGGAGGGGVEREGNQDFWKNHGRWHLDFLVKMEGGSPDRGGSL